jgi:cysteine desulfurase / selenocysteine lyase
MVGDRSFFPNLRYRSYLNHAAISPPSSLVQNVVNEVIVDFASNGVSSVFRWLEQRDVLRSKIAQIIETTPNQIGFVANTTTGILQAAWSVSWKPKDKIIVFAGEFPTNITPWQQVAKTFELDLLWIDATQAYKNIDKLLSDTEEQLRKGVRLLTISAVQFQTGLALPLKEIGQLCARYGALFFVDGIQAVGALPLSVKECQIHMLSCGSHKWLMGLEGCGFLYIDEKIISELTPRLTGWLSHENGLQFLFEGSGHLRYDRSFQSSASFVEGGAYNVVGFAALEKSIDIILSLGVSTIHRHINHYIDILEPQLENMGFCSLRHRNFRSGILSLIPPDGIDGKRVVEKLEASGVSCSYPDGYIRVAPHWPNNYSEVPLVVEAFQLSIAN